MGQWWNDTDVAQAKYEEENVPVQLCAHTCNFSLDPNVKKNQIFNISSNKRKEYGTGKKVDLIVADI
jgi:uncharacterized protein YraI